MSLERFTKVGASAAEEFAATGLEPHQFFMWAILKQNTMYQLPVSYEPSLSNLGEAVTKRLDGFLKTLQKEINEGHEIMALAKIYEQAVAEDHEHSIEDRLSMELVLVSEHGFGKTAAEKLAQAFHTYSESVAHEDLSLTETLGQFILVAMADWHADLAIYNRSEALKYGIPLENVQDVVMSSNFTKLGEDGLPIKNSEGKFEKGPNYIAPEGAIHQLLFQADDLVDDANVVIEEAAVIESAVLPLLSNRMSEVLDVVAAVAEEDQHGDSEEEEGEE